MNIEHYFIFIWCMFGFLDCFRNLKLFAFSYLPVVAIWTLGGPIMWFLRKWG